MKVFFIKKIVYYIMITVFGYISVYFIIDIFLNYKKEEGTIFIWGDSQTYFGLNLVEIKKSTGKKVYTAAKPGAGLYHFLLFSEKVPNESHIILGISELTQIRPNNMEFNRSVVNISPIIDLNNSPSYNYGDILSIIGNNRYPVSIFSSNSNLFPNSDTIIITQSLTLFNKLYSNKNNFLMDKQDLLLLGIKNLILKKCKITFIEFPYHSSLFNSVNELNLKKETKIFKYKIRDLFDNFKFDSISINDSKNMMYDLTHFNEYGATSSTKILIDKMKLNKKFTTMYIINGGVCN